MSEEDLKSNVESNVDVDVDGTKTDSVTDSVNADADIEKNTDDSTKNKKDDDVESDSLELKKRLKAVIDLEKRLEKHLSSELTPRTKATASDNNVSKQYNALEAKFNAMEKSFKEKEAAVNVDKLLDTYSKDTREMLSKAIKDKKYTSRQAIVYLNDMANMMDTLKKGEISSSERALDAAQNSIKDAKKAKFDLVGNSKDYTPKSSDIYNTMIKNEKKRVLDAI